MRAIHVISLCGFLVVVGLVLAFGRSRVLPAQPAMTPAAATLQPAMPPPPPLVPPLAPPPGPLNTAGPGQEGASAFPATAAASATPATAGLACIQNALGGVGVFAGVTSLRIVGNTKPLAITGMQPVASRLEIGVVFPDRYRESNVQTDAPAGSAPFTSVVGFNGNEFLFNLRPPEAAVAKWEHRVRLGFVREILMRLPRELADVRLSQRTTLDAGQERLSINASGLDDLDATLLADPRTCMPVALQYTAPSPTGPATYRVEFSEYRRFGGILFSTVLKTTKNGEPEEEQYDSEIQVNAPLGDEYFRRSGGLSMSALPPHTDRHHDGR